MVHYKRVTNVIKDYVVFFCKDCEKLVDTKAVGRKFAYRCSVCGTKNVAFGTEKAIRGYYRVKENEDGKEEKSPKKKEEKSESKAGK